MCQCRDHRYFCNLLYTCVLACIADRTAEIARFVGYVFGSCANFSAYWSCYLVTSFRNQFWMWSSNVLQRVKQNPKQNPIHAIRSKLKMRQRVCTNATVLRKTRYLCILVQVVCAGFAGGNLNHLLRHDNTCT